MTRIIREYICSKDLVSPRQFLFNVYIAERREVDPSQIGGESLTTAMVVIYLLGHNPFITKWTPSQFPGPPDEDKSSFGLNAYVLSMYLFR